MVSDATPRHEWPANRFDHRGHFKKSTIPGWVKVAVAERLGALPGRTTPTPCAYCGAAGAIWWPLTHTGKVGSWVALHDLEWDHIVAEFNGGPNTPENLTLACRPCNRSKGHR